ncbi:DUF397 domain-containing protein [Nocardia spumae]|uniref:DUF397 domain-containing protein n=1 Tax=Nocardia spumae TaxID=2887190 RepID=UPI001D14E167|nr:DUF397 domain-containing protein [Nocardia spumae]
MARGSDGSDCVEIAHLGDAAVAVRDSKDRTGPALLFTPGEWDSFTACLRSGGFDIRD